MPDYCHSCPYNKYCKDHFLSNPSCPMGYSPINLSAGMGSKADVKDGSLRSGHVLEPSILLNIAKAAINRNHYQTGIECYEKILEIDPTNNEAKFLLKRAKYMAEEEKSEKTSGDETDESSTEEQELEVARPAMLAQQQQLRSISIKPKQQYEVNRNIIGPDTEKVYGVEITENVKELEAVSKNVAIQSKGSLFKRRGIVIAFMLTIGIIAMIVVGLYMFGFLKV